MICIEQHSAALAASVKLLTLIAASLIKVNLQGRVE